MGDISIQVEKDKFLEKVEEKVSELPSKLVDLVEGIASNVEVIMIDEAPYRKGMLKRSITTESKGEFERWVGTYLEYAPDVVFGTRPHLIEATNAQALGPFQFSSYIGVGIGGYVDNKKAKLNTSNLQFFVSVHHPGTQPNDFITRAKDRSEDRNMEQIDKFVSWLTN